MFSNQKLKIKAGSSNSQVSQEIISNAIAQLSELTGLNEKESLNLINDSVKEKLPAPRMRRYINDNLINQNEADFINAMYN